MHVLSRLKSNARSVSSSIHRKHPRGLEDVLASALQAAEALAAVVLVEHVHHPSSHLLSLCNLPVSHRVYHHPLPLYADRACHCLAPTPVVEDRRTEKAGALGRDHLDHDHLSVAHHARRDVFGRHAD